MMMVVMRSLLSLLPLALLSVLSTACGASYDTEKVKDYRMAVLSDDPKVKAEFANLIEDFNEHAKMRVLTYVADAKDANSAIILTQGLQQRDGKVGWGQWMSNTDSDNPVVTMPGQKAKRTVEFSMRVEFDADYIKSRMVNEDAKKLTEKQKLFFHEVGHGLEMDHNEKDKSDLMFPDISGEKDFERFFSGVRRYMSDT